MCSPGSDHHVSSTSDIFDPFRIHFDHVDHEDPSDMINLGSSGKVLCFTCLSKSTDENLETIEYNLFENYVRSLFELLEEYCDNRTIRKIVLPVLEIILKRRTLVMRSDHDFHNILKVIYKVRNNKFFNRYEYLQLVRIYSSLCKGFRTTETMPLLSVWEATEILLDYSEQQLGQIPTIDKLDMDLMLSFEANSMLISSYLNLINKFSVDKTSDLIFPLSRNDRPNSHNRTKYRETQTRCLNNMREYLIETCWPILTDDIQFVEFGCQEKNLLGEIFNALKECFLVNLRMRNEEFSKAFSKLDPFLVAHQSISKTHDKIVREPINNFLKTYVYHYIDENLRIDKFVKDECFDEKEHEEQKIELNYRNVRFFMTSNSTKAVQKTISYLLLNYHAMKTESAYFNPSRVRKVLKLLDPEFINVNGSKTMMKIFLAIITTVIPSIMSCQEYETSRLFLQNYFRKIIDGEISVDINEIIAFDKIVFFWGSTIPVINVCIDYNTLEYFLNHHMKDEGLEEIIVKLLDDTLSTNLFDEYLENIESSSDLIEILCQREMNIKEWTPNSVHYHKIIIHHMRITLPALLDKTTNDYINTTPNERSTTRLDNLFKMTINLMECCEHFNLMLDDSFIEDLFILHRTLCAQHPRENETIMIMNDIIGQIILENNPHLLSVIKSFHYHSIGYLIHFVQKYRFGDKMGENIARLFVKYDDIDYPMIGNVCQNLVGGAQTALYWFLSDNIDLNILALKLAQRVIRTDGTKTAKACISTGLLHLLIKKRDFWKLGRYQAIAKSMVKFEEFLYNPLLISMMDNLPDFVIADVKMHRDPNSNLDSQDFDFDCDGSESITSGGTINDILTNLNQEDYGEDIPSTIPSSMMCAHSLPTRPRDSFFSESDEWEARAHNYHNIVNPEKDPS